MTIMHVGLLETRGHLRSILFSKIRPIFNFEWADM